MQMISKIKDFIGAMALAAVCATSYAPEATAETITLERAYELAHANSPQIEAQGYARDAAQAQVSEAKYYWAPKFALKSQFGPMPKSKDIRSGKRYMGQFLRFMGIYDAELARILVAALHVDKGVSDASVGKDRARSRRIARSK